MDIDKVLAEVFGPIKTPLTKLKKAVFPKYKFSKADSKGACSWKYDRDPPKAFVNLRMFDAATAAKLGVKPGPTMRLCFKPNEPGLLVSVASPNEATKIGDKFRKCADRQDDVKECALKAAGKKKTAFGGVRKGRK